MLLGVLQFQLLEILAWQTRCFGAVFEIANTTFEALLDLPDPTYKCLLGKHDGFGLRPCCLWDFIGFHGTKYPGFL